MRNPHPLKEVPQLWRASDEIAALHWLNGAGVTIHYLPGGSSRYYSDDMHYGHFTPHADVAVGVAYSALY